MTKDELYIKSHLINDLPNIYELEDMINFCKKYNNLYIYGIGENQEYLLKYFDMCNIKINGYVISQVQESYNFIYREAPVRYSFDVINEPDTGIIMGLSSKYYDEIIPKFHENNFNDYFIMTEYNKKTIAAQVQPRRKKGLLGFEINLANHCNLSCQMCDHYSQLSDKKFLNVDEFSKDMKRIGELFDHEIGAITLLGGEPTLHKDLIKCIHICRKEFPNTIIAILTNGILLTELEHSPEGNLWQVCKECNVEIQVTVYPLNINYKKIEEKAYEYGVTLIMSSNIHSREPEKIIKMSDKHTMDLSGNVDKFYCVGCLYFNKFTVLKEGKIYMCPISAHIDIFNKYFNKDLKITNKDYLDIYKINDWTEIADFASNYVPFCSYCDLKNWGHHSTWKASSKKIDEYV